MSSQIRGPGWEDETNGEKAMLFHGLGDHLRQHPHWPAVRALARGPLRDEDMAEYLRGCQTVIGLNQGRDRHGRVTSSLNLCDLEFPGRGCCYLTEHTWATRIRQLAAAS